MCGDEHARNFIEEYGRHDRTRWEKLTTTACYDDDWEGRAIWANTGGTARGSLDEHHPRRGNGALFSKFETILGKFGLSRSSINASEVNYQIVPAGGAPLPRVVDGRFQCARKFGIPAAGQTSMRPVKACARERVVPEWTLSDEKCRLFIQHAYPPSYGKSSTRATKRAAQHRAQLGCVLYLFYRCLCSVEEIAEELSYDAERVNYISYHAQRHGDVFFSAEGCGHHRPGLKGKSAEDAETPLEPELV